MELKAVHLIRRLERIDRDIVELNQLQQGIREDREYSKRIMDPLVDEAARLKKLKSRILSQIIKNPPENLIYEKTASDHKVHDVEITINSSDKKKEKKKVESTENQKKDPASKPGQKKGNPYKFIFDQDK